MEVKNIIKTELGFTLELARDEEIQADALLVASGSQKKVQTLLANIGHTIIPQVPSLFTFNVPSSPYLDLLGASVNPVHLRIRGTKLEQTGPLLITHWGFSGPAVLKLSAWGARILNECKYKATLVVNWLPEQNKESSFETLLKIKTERAQKTIYKSCPPQLPLPTKLWQRMLELLKIEKECRWSTINNKTLRKLSELLCEQEFKIEGKSTFKEEFVTCGGLSLKEVNFKTMESKIHPGLFFAGELLDIDGVTGGFNFQNAWTTSWIAASSIS
jgi:predicted Rossmann fold flavoprotein